MERYLPVNLLWPGPRLVEKEFTGPRSHKGWETLRYVALTCVHLSFLSRAVEALQGAHPGAERNAHKQNSKFFLNIRTPEDETTRLSWNVGQQSPATRRHIRQARRLKLRPFDTRNLAKFINPVNGRPWATLDCRPWATLDCSATQTEPREKYGTLLTKA